MDLFDIRGRLNSGGSIYDIPMSVTYYARVSTDKDEQLHSLSAQVKYYSDFIKSNPNWVFVEGYVDEGRSGTSVQKREAFLRMIEDARGHRFDFIVTKEISRFSRNTVDSIKYTQELLASGVGVLFQSDNINTLYPDAELRLAIMSSIAQDEVRKISERVKFGFKRSIEKGVVLGNNNIWGYKKDRGRLVVVEEEAEIVRRVFDLYANENMGLRSIARWLDEHGHRNSRGNTFSCSSLKNILTNPKYKGYYCGNKTQKYDYRRNERKQIENSDWVMYKDEDSVPPVICEEIWDRANEIMEHRRKKMSGEAAAGYQNKYAYSGKIICAEHNTPYYRTLFKYKSCDKEAWRCRRYAENGTPGCASPTVYTAELDEITRRIMRMLVTDKTGIVNELIKIYSDIPASQSISEAAGLSARIGEIMKKKDRLLELSIRGKLSDDEFELRNNAFNSELDSLRERVEDYKRREKRNSDYADQTEKLRAFIAEEMLLNEAAGAGITDRLLDRVEVYGTDEKKLLILKVFLRACDEPIDFQVMRRRNRPSVINCLLRQTMFMT